MERLRGEAWLNSPQKRAEDILLATSVMPVAGPPSVIGAIAFRLIDKDSPIFKQKRVGRAGVLFTIYKLRTMPGVREDKSSNGLADHEQRGRVGKYLSKLCIDEFPQVVNVLRGEMSVIAPRALIPVDFDVARKILGPRIHGGWIDLREKVKPGILDLYGIRLNNRQIPNDISEQYAARVESDKEMIEEASLKNDMKILVKAISMFADAALWRKSV